MNFCQSCGKALDPGAPMCAYCGAITNQPVAAAAAPAAIAASSPGMSQNTAGALTYVAGFITAIIFLAIDPYKSDPFVRFHAFQSLFFNLAWIGFWVVWAILGIALSAVTKGLFFFIQTPIDLLLMLGGFILWAYLMYSASQGKTFRIPIIGGFAAKQAGI
jgi:uncharacterized membrane protein